MKRILNKKECFAHGYGTKLSLVSSKKLWYYPANQSS